MTGWMKALLIGGASLAGAAAIAAVVYFGLHYFQKKAPIATTAVISSSSPDFTKAAYQVDSSGNLVLDSNGDPVPFSGPVHPGDQVEYVLTYKVPASGTTGPITITDTLSANQTYVDPSIQAPPGWTYPASPGYPGNSETYSNLGVGPGAGFTMTVAPIGPAVGTAGNSTGDGFQPIPVAAAGRVYGVWHHKPDTRGDPGIMCWSLADLSPCNGFSKAIGAGSDRLITPNWPHAVVLGAKIYFPAGREQAGNTAADLGIGCWDTATETPCPFIALPGNPTYPRIWTSAYNNANMYGGISSAYLAGLAADPAQPTHLIINANNQLYCIDTTTSAPCAAWVSSPPVSGVVVAGEVRDMIAEDGPGGTRVFLKYNGSSASARIACRLLATGANCPGWALIGGSSESVLAARTTAYLTISPVPAGSGWTAVCAHQATQGPPSCVKTADGTGYAMPAIFTAPAGPFNGTDNIYAPAGNARYVVAAFHIPGTQQVLYPYYISRTQPFCFDFATNAACAGFNAVWNSNNNNPVNPILNDSRDYGYAADPTDPDHCLLGLGDHEIVWRFRRDGAMGRGVCVQQHVQQTFDINTPFCAKKPKQANWTTVEIVGRPPELTGGTLVIKDSTGAVVQTIPVTGANSYPVNLPATGTNATLNVEFMPNYGTNTPPTGSYQIKLNYTADIDPQICYRAIIKDCTEGAPPIDASNHAVYTDALGTKDADVNLGKVVGGHCGPPPCLLDLKSSVTLNPDGTGTLTIAGSAPPGFTPTVLNVHANTPGVAVAPPTRTLPPGPINTTFVLTGIAPGQSVDIQIDAVDRGAGTNGSDKCCSSTVTVVVPDDHHHQHTDVAIQKTGISEGQGPANGSGYTYTLAVTNISDPINGQNNVIVTDVVPAGLSFASAGGTNWTCTGPFPIAAGGMLSCTYTGTGLVATGQPLPPITVVSTNAVPGTQLPSVTNCARVGLATSSGLTDYEPSNDQSCITNGREAANGSLTVIKVVKPVQGHDDSSVVFQAYVTCTPPGGAAVMTTLALRTSNGYTRTIPSLVSGTVCAITEPAPPAPPVDPRNCHWDTSYPDGEQVTIASGNVIAHIVNSEICVTPTDSTVLIEKTVMIDGHVSTRTDQSFPIHGTCKAPGGTSVNLGFTASAATGFRGPRQSVPSGARCTVQEPMPAPPRGRRECRWETSYLFNRKPVTFPVTIGAHTTNLFEVRNELQCDEIDHPSDRLCSEDDEHWNGKRCVTCPRGQAWNEQTRACTVPSLTCRDPMMLNDASTACVCRDGTRPRNGQCRHDDGPVDDTRGRGHWGDTDTRDPRDKQPHGGK